VAADPNDARHRDVGRGDGAGLFAGQVEDPEEDDEEGVAATAEPERVPVLRDYREYLSDGCLAGSF
jgi:hypothetical protein